MTAPTEAEIRELLTIVTSHGPGPLDVSIPVSDRVDDALGEIAGQLDHLYDIDDLRTSERGRFDELVRSAIDPIRERVTVEIEAALLRAALQCAAEYPDAPRAVREPVPA